MFQNWLLILPILIASMGSLAQKTVVVYSGDDILIDANVIRGQLGYTWVGIDHLNDTIRNRKAQMADMRCEFRLASAAIDKYMNFVVHDALYMDIALGKMTSKTLGETLPEDSPIKEGRFSTRFAWGYDFYTGYRNKHWGLLAGICAQWSMLSIGDFSSSSTRGGLSVFNFSYPVALRGEWRPFSHYEYRIILKAWHALPGKQENSGLRIEIPTLPKSRFWLFAEMASYHYEYLYLSTDPCKQGKTSLFTCGFKFGSIF